MSLHLFHLREKSLQENSDVNILKKSTYKDIKEEIQFLDGHRVQEMLYLPVQ